jgi:hypothetical protein
VCSSSSRGSQFVQICTISTNSNGGIAHEKGLCKTGSESAVGRRNRTPQGILFWTILQRIENEPNLLNSIITCDETWIFMKREDQQDATIRCLLLTSVSTCFGHHYTHLQENKGPVTAFGVSFCKKRENEGISREVFFCVVNLVGNSSVFANVMCKWVSWRLTGICLVSFPVCCIGGGCFDVCVVPV